MKPYGAKRTFAKCRTFIRRMGGKIHVSITVKNRKRDRAAAKLETKKEAEVTI
ncbi:hypothetical protein [Bradyrhizobium sp. SZCCHNRI2010]|uniref:hypothetical protein n=1 Tax=Bradyrhizobium sp. SZCCHNRI2010 TaxID=3057283 RepID=UPI0028ECA4F4|nr:hypothetical protein [Bradyrhizobium sp. SZCCHNRI2010]